MGVGGDDPEVTARGQGYVYFRQCPLAELPCVQPGTGYIEVHVESAIGDHRYGKADRVQGLKHDFAAGPQFGASTFALRQRRRFEGSQSRLLRGRRSAQEVVHRQALDLLNNVPGHDSPAEAPSGHAEVLGETVDDQRLRIGAQHASGGHAELIGVSQLQIDLIDDAPPVARAGQLADGGQFVEGNGCAGRVRGAGQHDRAGSVGPGVRNRRAVELVARSHTCRHGDNSTSETAYDLAIAGVRRVSHEHLVTRLDRGGDSQ